MQKQRLLSRDRMFGFQLLCIFLCLPLCFLSLLASMTCVMSDAIMLLRHHDIVFDVEMMEYLVDE